MRRAVGLRFDIMRGGAAGAGVSGGPVITGTPLLTDSEIIVNGALPITFYGKTSASATPLTSAAIEAAPDDTAVLAGGANYLPALNLQTSPGTWYYNYFAKNASGSSGVETESYVVSAPMEINSFNSDNGFSSAPTCLVGPTAAGDSILIAAMVQGTASISMSADFTAKGTIATGSDRMSLFEWNGGGTRPNNTNITVNFGASSNYVIMTMVVKSAAVTNFTNGTLTSGTSHTLPTVAKTNRCIALAVMHSTDATMTPTGPSPVPPSAPTLPGDDGYWSVLRPGNFRMHVFAYYDATSGGTTPAITFDSSFADPKYILAAVED